MIIKSVNVKKQACDVYVGRPSTLGNPFVLGKDGNRETVVAKYKDWLSEKLMTDTPQQRKVIRIAALA